MVAEDVEMVRYGGRLREGEKGKRGKGGEGVAILYMSAQGICTNWYLTDCLY